MHPTLTLERILAPVIPEYQECVRCGVSLSLRRAPNTTRCVDCRGIDSVPLGGKQHKCIPVDAAFEVTVHYRTRNRPGSPTYQALCALRIPCLTVVLAEDATAERYVTQELGATDEIVVLITSHGRYVTHWEGRQPHLLAHLPVMRQKYVKQLQEAVAA